ncbi:MAG: putative two-component system sensor kinase [Actinoallomurus sp.]|nr:putative two-component system sensor kinase [Actinoallomurus sp.]
MRGRLPVSPVDVLLSAGVFAAFLPYAHRNNHFPLVVTLGALDSAALLARRRFPLPTLAVCLALSGVLAMLLRRSYPATPADLVALYSVGRYCSRGAALTVAIVTILIGFAVAAVSENIPSYDVHNISSLGWVLFAVIAGAWVRIQRTHVIGAEERAERAEREREEEARRRVTEERLRIARELHDIVGHALMSINVTSSVSARLVDRDPEAGREALRTISALSSSALGEIRGTLSLLREGAEPLKRPGLGLDDLADLVEQTRVSGVPVTLHESGFRPDVPAIVGFTVYRVVQESLTNIARHAKDVTEVTVSLSFTAGSLDVSVTNDGAMVETPLQTGTGLGIQGMRERVAATGGRLCTTALPSGGFRVHARLPLKEGS